MRDILLQVVLICGLLIASVLFAGCAGIEPPTPEEIVKHPFGTPTLRIGMNKDQIIAGWGDPDVKEYNDSGKWGNARERWIYYGRYKELPADVGYLSKTKILYFDGNNVVKIEDGE